MAEDTIYLTVGDDHKGNGMIAIITQGHPQLGDQKVTILSLTRVSSNEEAEAWYQKEMTEKPWETRN